MRRLFGPVVGLLWLGVTAHPVTAQERPAPWVVIKEPRPNPVFPAALIPFSIPTEVCQKGHVPVVTFTVQHAGIRKIATLVLRSKGRESLDSLKLPCGNYVAIWDGVFENVDGTQRIAPVGIYFLQFTIDGRLVAAAYTIFVRPM